MCTSANKGCAWHSPGGHDTLPPRTRPPTQRHARGRQGRGCAHTHRAKAELLGQACHHAHLRRTCWGATPDLSPGLPCAQSPYHFRLLFPCTPGPSQADGATSAPSPAGHLPMAVSRRALSTSPLHPRDRKPRRCYLGGNGRGTTSASFQYPQPPPFFGWAGLSGLPGEGLAKVGMAQQDWAPPGGPQQGGSWAIPAHGGIINHLLREQ